MSTPADSRLASLDAFRGFAIAAMVLVNNPGDWDHVYRPLAHAKWNGWTFTDWVFPFFLFAVGMSMAISIDRRKRGGDTPGAVMVSIAKRAAVIFLVGLALNLFPAFDFSTVRIPGVLQRIALCVLMAAPFAIHAGNRGIAAGAIVLFAIYTVLMLFVPVPGPDGVVAAGALEPGRDFGAWLDRTLLGGHLWSQSKTWDPEGLVGTLAAACNVLFGVIAGRWLLAHPGRSLKLAAAGGAVLLAGSVLDAVFMPINKSLWTPSYAVYMTGASLVFFGLFHAFMGRWALAFVIYGMNALFIFALSGFIGRALAAYGWKAPLYAPIQSLPISPENASLLYAVAFNLVMFAIAWAMWKKGWFVKA